MSAESIKTAEVFPKYLFFVSTVTYYLPSLENQTKLELADRGPGEYV